MSTYLYVDRDSHLHRMDPRGKMIALFGLLLLSLSVETPILPGTLILAVLLCAHIAGVWGALRRVRPLLTVISIFSLISWTLLGKGTTVLFGPVTYESLLYGVGTALKLCTAISASAVFLATTKNEAIAAGLIRFGLPYNAAFAFSTALRLVPTFVGTGATIVQAQRSRGLDVESGSLLERIRKYLPLIVPIFAGAIRSTNTLAMALESKGFGSGRRRSYYLQLQLRPADWAAIALGSLMILAYLFVKLVGYGKIAGFGR